MTQANIGPGTGVLSTAVDSGATRPSVATAPPSGAACRPRSSTRQNGLVRRGLLAGMLLLASIAPAGASAAVRLEPVGTFTAPVFVTSLPGDPDRLLVVEQRGTIQLVDHGVASTFLDLRHAGLVSAGGERGLLSVALAPDYPSTPPPLRLLHAQPGRGAADRRVHAPTAAPWRVSTRRPVLTIPHPTFPNHNGGQLQFGPDGMLYIATGDGGRAATRRATRRTWDPCSARSCGSTRGPPARPRTRSPPDNPFARLAGSGPTACATPGASRSTGMTGDLLIGDVGQDEREEVDYAVGTRRRPRRQLRLGLPRGHDRPSATRAVLRRPPPGSSTRSSSTTTRRGRCAITGGYVVRDPSLGDLYGRYLFADSCAGPIRSLVPGLPDASGARSEGLSVGGPSSFGEDSCGRVYVASLGTGEVSRFVGDAPASCATDGGRRGHAAALRRRARRPGVAGDRPCDRRLARRRRDRRRRPRRTGSSRAAATT